MVPGVPIYRTCVSVSVAWGPAWSWWRGSHGREAQGPVQPGQWGEGSGTLGTPAQQLLASRPALFGVSIHHNQPWRAHPGGCGKPVNSSKGRDSCCGTGFPGTACQAAPSLPLPSGKPPVPPPLAVGEKMELQRGEEGAPEQPGGPHPQVSSPALR